MIAADSGLKRNAPVDADALNFLSSWAADPAETQSQADQDSRLRIANTTAHGQPVTAPQHRRRIVWQTRLIRSRHARRPTAPRQQ